jgi:hypothetical protein
MYLSPMAYPAELELDADLRIANWRPLVHWLLVIPHMIVVQVLGYVAPVVAVISWFAIVFTGNLPAGLANVQCMIIRYGARTYSYGLWLRQPYPPFEFATTPEDPGGDPLRVELRPALEGRNRLTVALRLLWVIPAAIFVMVLLVGAAVAAFLSFFAVLFTGRYPAGLRDFVVKVGLACLRVAAYTYLLTDEYPPFALE